MKISERHETILQLLKAKGEISFTELRHQIPEVSEMTLRRDLQQLDQEKKLIRIHGGAKSLEAVVNYREDVFQKRFVSNTDAKMVIARKAAALVREHDNIFLDSGTTCTFLAKQMPDLDYSVTTTGLSCAMELAQLKKPKLTMVGGNIYKDGVSVNGDLCVNQLKDMCFNRAFIGVSGYIQGRGFVTAVAEDYLMKRTIIRQSRRIIVLIDHSKVDQWGSHIIASMDEVFAIVSDDSLSEAVSKEWQERGITVF